MRLEGRRVLITGASRGLGAALARGVRARGAEVALVARSAAPLGALAAELDGRAYPCDLADPQAVVELVDRVEADGPVDVLINNAGVAHVGWFGDRTLEEIEQIIAVNLRAPLLLMRLLLPRMLERGRGQVVNISSLAAVIAPPGLVTYSATKAGLSHATAGLRADFRGDPITFTLVQLGSVDTDMDREARSYGPLRELAERSKGRDITPLEVFVRRVVDAIERDRPRVDLPPAARPLAAAVELPRRVGRLLFRRASVRELRRDQG